MPYRNLSQNKIDFFSRFTMEQQSKEAMKKILQNSKGAGLGAGLLIAAGIGAYGVLNSMFTGIKFITKNFKFF